MCSSGGTLPTCSKDRTAVLSERGSRRPIGRGERLEDEENRDVLAAHWVGLLVPACESSNSPLVPQCMNPRATGPNSTSCDNCLASRCSSEDATYNIACPSFAACYEACDCSDWV